MSSEKFKIFIFTALVVFLFLQAKEINAGAGDNVWGWAWSNMDDLLTLEDEATIGWISFNSTSGGGSIDYGVHITEIDSATAVFSGYAYYDLDDPNTPTHETGWVSFNRDDTGAPPGDPDYGTYLAQTNLQTGEVSGWARALTYGGGWDGWIKLRKHIDDWGVDYGVYIDKNTGDFHGWAWGLENLVGPGWLSFNCENQGVCLDSDYKVETSFVFNKAPQAIELGYIPDDYCSPWSAFLSWEFDDPDAGDTQSAYRVEIATDIGFLNIINRSCDPGLINPNAVCYSVCNDGERDTYTPSPGTFQYGTPYYWRVKVWDSSDLESDNWAEGASFTTLECHPFADFTWEPYIPPLETEVQFTDASSACGGASIVSRRWEFENGNPDEVLGNELFPVTTFIAIGDNDENQVILTVVDSNGNSCPCSPSKYVPMALPLPEWTEIIPL